MDELVEVAFVGGEPQATMIQALLEENGIARGGRKPRSYGLIGGYARIYLWGFGLMALAFGIFMFLRAV